jgi:hypothetical protein
VKVDIFGGRKRILFCFTGIESLILTYSVFHQFRQTKFAYVGSILSSSQFFATPPAASKNNAHYKRGQN